MSTSKHIDKICIIAIVLSLILTTLFIGCGHWLNIDDSMTMGYEDRIFDTSKVHSINIEMEDWDGFIQNCEDKEYVECSVTIDGEKIEDVGIRAKGKSSLDRVSSSNSNRYSFKIEFDQYDDSKNYHGLDKLNLNNIISDPTYMKDYIVYQAMDEFGVDAPLCSYAYITVNGEDWGLYLAIEGVEESFLQRNYGSNYGELYKPDSTNKEKDNLQDDDNFNTKDAQNQTNQDVPVNKTANPDFNMEETPKQAAPNGGGDMKGDIGSDDVKLKYIDDNPESYSNIFENAKTDVTEADQQRLIASLKALNQGENIEEIVDVDKVIRYFVVHNFVCNGDSYTGTSVHNYYLYEEDGKLCMIPWDYNEAFGTFNNSDASSAINDPIDTPVSGGVTDDRPMVDWIFKSEEYTKIYHQYFNEFLNTVDFSAIIDQTANLISYYVEKDPTKFYTYEEFEKGTDTLKQFCLLRSESIKGQLEGTIPSTTEGQEANPDSLIDASSISLSDIGGKGNGEFMGGMGTPQPGDFEKAEGLPQDFQEHIPTNANQVQAIPTESTSANEGVPQTQPSFNQEATAAPPQANADGAGQNQQTFPTDDTNAQAAEQSTFSKNVGENLENANNNDFQVPQKNQNEMMNKDTPTAASPTNSTDSAAQEQTSNPLISFVSAFMVLFAGLFIAFKYKRH